MKKVITAIVVLGLAFSLSFGMSGATVENPVYEGATPVFETPESTETTPFDIDSLIDLLVEIIEQALIDNMPTPTPEPVFDIDALIQTLIDILTGLLAE